MIDQSDKVSMVDQSENLTFFGCLGSTVQLVRTFFCEIETVIYSHSSLCQVTQVPFQCNVLKETL
jgi:hypothetical protein